VNVPKAPSDPVNSAARNALHNLAQWGLVVVGAPRARPPRLSVGIGVALALTLIAAVVSMFVLDTAASSWARALPSWFNGAFERITDFGLSGWFLFPFGFLLLGLAVVKSPALPRLTQGVLGQLAARTGFLFLAIALPGLFDTIVKRLIGRARPYVGSHDDPFAYLPFIWRSEYASMPSGHATTAAAAAVAIAAVWPRARLVMWFYALTIMASRVIVLAHHPSDVLAGAVVGTAGALMVRRWFAARRLVFSARDLRAFPGPSWRRIGAALRQAVAGVPASH
jgi:undecaprenyl-diphosphatase